MYTPAGPECFFVLDGDYTFIRADEMVVTPPDLEHYFTTIADRVRRGPVTLDEEFAVAARFGQEFLDRAGHWAQA